jgi:hypothetical protein
MERKDQKSAKVNDYSEYVEKGSWPLFDDLIRGYDIEIEDMKDCKLGDSAKVHIYLKVDPELKNVLERIKEAEALNKALQKAADEVLEQARSLDTIKTAGLKNLILTGTLMYPSDAKGECACGKCYEAPHGSSAVGSATEIFTKIATNTIKLMTMTGEV